MLFTLDLSSFPLDTIVLPISSTAEMSDLPSFPPVSGRLLLSPFLQQRQCLESQLLHYLSCALGLEDFPLLQYSVCVI